MSKAQTDNSFLVDKVKLRINHLPDKNSLKVLDCYGGDGRIWRKIIKETRKEIEILHIDQKDKRHKGLYLRGDNLKFLKTMDLTKFNIIDLDAYGQPIRQLESIFDFHKKRFLDCMVFVTFIQSGIGGLNRRMLTDIGYSKKMIEKIPTLFARDGIGKFKNWLALKGVKNIAIRSFDRKHYLAFKLT